MSFKEVLSYIIRGVVIIALVIISLSFLRGILAVVAFAWPVIFSTICFLIVACGIGWLMNNYGATKGKVKKGVEDIMRETFGTDKKGDN